MRLTKSMFHQIRDALGLPPTAAALEPACKRRAPRFGGDVAIPFARDGAGVVAPQTVRLRDISAAGVCVVTPHLLGAGDRFLLHLPMPGDRRVMVLCLARQSRLMAGGGFRIGAEFISPCRENGSMAFVQTGAGLRQRAGAGATRGASGPAGRAISSAGVATLDDDEPADDASAAMIYAYGEDGPAGPLERVDVLERSDRGVAILRPRGLVDGARFVLDLAGEGGEPVARLCRVTESISGQGRFRVSAKFVPLPRKAVVGREVAPAGVVSRLRRWFS